jgi:hypothetical protein
VPPAGRFNLTGAMDTEVTATFGDVGYTYAAEGGNCVVYSADDVRHVHAGAVTVAWAPASPAQQSLRLVVSPDPHGEAAEATGASPLRVDVPDLDVATRLALYVTAASEPGAIVRQPMRLEWSLDYDGAASPADPSTHARCG